MRCALWPDASANEHQPDIESYLSGRSPETQAVLVAEASGSLVGLAELSIRSYAEGCRTNRVAYLEGWFVDPRVRRQGVGRALVSAAEDWGRAHGCKEFGSDTQADNDESAAAHAALGFEEVGVVRAFRKDLQA
jgi:aminoglycoside 6'-N-acetyltransferase I